MTPTPDVENLRMMTKVAHLYHSRGMVQTDIAKTLGISQARVSRLLASAEEEKIIRTVVVSPPGLFAEVEQELERRFGLLQAHVIDASGETEEEGTESAGLALAPIFQILPMDDKTIGFTSWSRSMREFVVKLDPFTHSSAKSIVEMLGGVGEPGLQHQATSATQKLAEITNAKPLFLRVPGVVSAPEMKAALLENDSHAELALDTLNEVDIALVGIGAATPSSHLTQGVNFFSDEQFARARELGAVGEINLRFLDKDGNPVRSELDDVIIGVELEQLRRAERRIGVSVGSRKHPAVLAALRGGWVNVLVTDIDTATFLLEKADS